ncbi:hypothetical protein A3A70_00220 [candidate division WWE3 bacterium RIFCSPLOWO2_01_FULL_42_11]|uniref:VTT domain-containing protein n=1 Tax=candidate division WWE3 bacterium RIFCSPLOWO2_01_FULL_42_11 TaxID=1802627 RepID=A0A1F4VLQ7_UNCKA|nr:MAG: hypothetical protein A3A70_00220 [candidate division WWE3 bacterium RIFCSPLOWO2_01_FULL_42_11]
MLDSLLHPESLSAIITSLGILGLIFIVFAESGLFFGFFLPGDSLLFTAGLLASQGVFSIQLLLLILPIAAILGDSAGYFTGRHFGNWLLKRPDNLIFKRSYILKAEKFYAMHGGKAIVLARFMPAVRTFVPIVAGLANMPYSSFVFFNVFGGILWTTSLLLLGYFLGQKIPNVDHYLLPIIALIVILSVLPGIIHLIKDRTPTKI